MATKLMLLAPVALVTPFRLECFAWFCFGSGSWDLFSYPWLKVALDRPDPFATADLLFLVLVPWGGPGWCPCGISVGLIAFAVVILRAREAHLGGRVPMMVGACWSRVLC